MTVPPAKQWIGTIGQHPMYWWDRRAARVSGYSAPDQIADGPAGKLDVLEMSVLEGGGIFKPETEHAIRAEMRRPNEGIRQEFGMNAAGRNGDKEQRPDVSVDGIVDECSHANVHKIPEHKKIGSQNEQEKERPTRAKVRVEKDAQKQNNAAFDVEKNPGSRKHFSRIACAGRRVNAGENRTKRRFARCDRDCARASRGDVPRAHKQPAEFLLRAF